MSIRKNKFLKYFAIAISLLLYISSAKGADNHEIEHLLIATEQFQQSLSCNEALVGQNLGVENQSSESIYSLWSDSFKFWSDWLKTSGEVTGSLARGGVSPRDIYQKIAPFFGPTAGKFTLVLPAYKEGHRIERSIAMMKLFLAEFPLNLEVLYIVEKSPDDTLLLGQHAARGNSQITVHDNLVQKGKGYAIRTGVQMATGDIIFYNDTDLSVPLHHILYFLANFIGSQSTDIIIGERVRFTTRSFNRKVMTSVFHNLMEQVTGLPGEWDTQCGFKGFRRKVAEEIFSRQTLNGFTFDIEALLLAQKLGYTVQSQKVLWFNDERSTVRPLIDPAKMAWELYGVKRHVDKNFKTKEPQ